LSGSQDDMYLNYMLINGPICVLVCVGGIFTQDA